MNQLQIFQNNTFGQVRVVEQKGEPWFVAKDVCDVFAVTNRNRLMQELDNDEKGYTQMDTPGGKQSIAIVNEAGLYQLLFSLQPNKAKARGIGEEEIQRRINQLKEFKRWVTHEVIPSIRKHGAYLTDDVAKQVVQDPSFLIQIAQALQEEKAKRQEAEAMVAYQEQQIAEFKPVKDYVDQILSSTSTMTITQIAADYDLTAVQLNKILHEAGLQRKVGDQWILYKRHMSKGYTKSETFTFKRSDGRDDAKINTKWTQKGRLKIHEILTKRGIKAVCTEVA